MVLLADDPVLKRPVALKVMHPDLAADKNSRKRFLREAQATAAIDHHHIVHIHQVGEENGVPFIVMPLLKGEALDTRLKREKRLPVAVAVQIGKQIAEGLAVAHKHGLVHRDIKPANIWLDEDSGWVKIVDFGLARALVGDDVHLTRTGAILGTPAYMAPEQARGEKVDYRCDLYSLGAVLYRMLTGELPFKGQNTMALLMALATEVPAPVAALNPAVPPAVAELVMQLLAKDAAARPSSARAVAELLGGSVGDQTIQLAPAAVPESQRGLSRRPRFLPFLRTVAKGFGAVLWSLRPWAFRRPGVAWAIGGAVLVLLLLLVSIPFGLFGTSVPAVEPKVVPPPEPLAKVITNSIDMQLVLIPAGKFLMGSPKGEVGREANEEQHEVEITKPFYLGKFHVTLGQFRKFVADKDYHGGKNYRGSTGTGNSDDHPVVNVSWNDAVAFCAWLSKKEGKTYRLPTEAEWEYSCRAGTKTAYYFGDDAKDLKHYGWYSGNSGGRAQPVGKLKSNDWGLCDMHGNVWQWCSDYYKADYYKEGSRRDPQGPAAGASRVLRGGSCVIDPPLCRAARRNDAQQVYSNNITGFRVVRVTEGPSSEPPAKSITNSVGMKLVLIPAGKFLMGSPKGEEARADNEEQHEVEITRSFYLGKFHVTLGQFRRFVEDKAYHGGKNYPTPGSGHSVDHPVVNVSWRDAVAFCDWLSKKEGKTYRLPTEAEWEYSCRAGTKTAYYFGDDVKDLKHYAWYNGNSGIKAQPVGKLKPNAWGLCDMHGNVWQWCSDYYKEGSRRGRQGPAAGASRVCRGGSFDNDPRGCRAASRGGQVPSNRTVYLGFRVVRVR
jgi:formylglycine-generating enzyme required for sulfatase activity